MGTYIFKLPDLGEGTVESEIVEWHVAAGDQVSEDQHIADVMTDKATVEISSPVTGSVDALGCAAGDVLAVGAPLITFTVEGEGNVSEEEAAAASAPAAEPAVEVPAVDAAPVEAAAPVSTLPGNYVFKLPDLGEGTVESEIVEWHVAVGDSVSEDQHIADVMTDKATVEISAPASGTVAALGCDAGAVLAVGAPLITFNVEGEGNVGSEPVAAPAPAAAPAPKAAAPKPAAKPAAKSPSKPAAPKVAANAPVAATAGQVLTSPSVRKRAMEADIDLTQVPGSGPAGRISHEDLDDFIAAGGKLGGLQSRKPLTGIEEIPVRGLRRKIAEKMQMSKQRIAHFTYGEEIDVTAVEELRQHLNATRTPDQPKLTLLPFIMQAMVKCLKQFPQFNATFDDNNNVITRYEGVHIGIAAQTDDGLKVPVVKHAEALDIWQSATEMLRVSSAAKDNTATMDELTGASITITSLGPLGGTFHTPVVNYPEVAIIGTNKMIEKPVVRNGEIVIRKTMNMSSSFDHRVIDGYDAAQLIQQLKAYLENPATIFM